MTRDGENFEASRMMIATWYQVRWYNKPGSTNQVC